MSERVTEIPEMSNDEMEQHAVFGLKPVNPRSSREVEPQLAQTWTLRVRLVLAPFGLLQVGGLGLSAALPNLACRYEIPIT